MRAFHVNSTRPFIEGGNKKEDYSIDDFEILTTILSALKWREHNGGIKLYTDSLGLEYYQKLGITRLWDLGIDTEVLEGIEGFNFQSFWAGGKLFALENEETPCCMIDTDFIVWDSIQRLIEQKKANTIVIHKEDLIEGVYLPKNYLKVAKGYQFDPKWDWRVLPCNTAFAYFGDTKLKDNYTREAIRFMQDNLEDAKERVSQMVFAEQRLLSMVAKKMGVKIASFIEDPSKLDQQNYFTHVWGAKQKFRDNVQERKEFCVRSVSRIVNDFPEWESLMKNNFAKYIT